MLDALSSKRSFSVPLSAGHANESYNTNSPSANQVTDVRNYSDTCACVARVAAATFQGGVYFAHADLPIVRLLFEGGDYLRVASI